jgi:hypothetical protein
MWRIWTIGLISAGLFAGTCSGDADDFGQHFLDATLRVDFYQSGDAETEILALDRLIRQGTWAGPVDDLVAPSVTGRTRVRVIDPETQHVLFEETFDSLFGEYRTTSPARDGVVRIHHESVLLPFPKRPIRVEFASTADGTRLLEFVADPRSVDIAEEPPSAGAIVVDGHVAGDPHTSLDIAFVGEGYQVLDADAFRADVRRFSDLMLRQEPYASAKDRINIRGVMVPSADPGCDEPTMSRWRRTSVGASFNSLSSPRYLLTEDNRALRNIAANVPYDTLVIMVNHDRYGGGGLYNRYCTFTAHGPFAGYLLLHEFGHSFGGLADEYYTSSTAYTDFYPAGVEPDAPNVTALLDGSELKWADLATPEIELPTPWDKQRYDAADLAYQQERRRLNAEIADAARSGADAAEIDRLRRAEDRHALDRVAAVDAFIDATGQAELVGAFEGAGYASEGLFRPAIDCLMFTRGVKPLCPVCRAAVAARIARYTGGSQSPVW